MMENDIQFDNEIISLIYKEANSIMKLNGWNLTQLKAYEEELNVGLSKYETAESDILHALEKYKADNNGENPQAYKMERIAYMLSGVRYRHKNIKQCLNYIKILEDAIINGYSMEKTKSQLIKVTYEECKGRTKYYQMTLDLLG